MGHFWSAIASADFIRSLTLLLVTSGVAGLLVPQIVAILADRRHRGQKIFEAELARQRDVLQAQSELLKAFSACAWRWQLLNINVSFCRLEAEEPRYKKAAELYEAEVPAMLGQLRAEISAARRLVSPAMHERLKTYYYDTLLRVDAQLSALIRQDETATRKDWRTQHHNSFHDAQDQLEKVLGELAVELDLTAPRAIVT